LRRRIRNSTEFVKERGKMRNRIYFKKRILCYIIDETGHYESSAKK